MGELFLVRGCSESIEDGSAVWVGVAAIGHVVGYETHL